ncbi:MAG: methionyl-tRNA formyltransferase [Spirochaetales bacterium]|nr:methionyl-tRNA formyltransferase [Spirochaetales bacterium]
MSTRTTPFRILFAGTPESALFSLEAAWRHSTEWHIEGVLTNPDAPSGRGRRVRPSPVKAWALEHEVPILQPEHLRGEAREAVSALAPDLLVVVAYGRIFGPRFLALFPEGGINVHPSLLPRHRGPSPLQAAILSGDAETGVTVQYLAPEMDSGDIILQERIALPDDVSTSALHDDLGRRGAALLVEAIDRIAAGDVTRTPQDHERATYCRKIERRDGRLDWSESALTISRMVRAYTPWPGVVCSWGGRALQFTEATHRSAPPVAVVGGKRPEKTRPGEVVAVDNGLGILIQTTDGLVAVRRLKLQTRKEMDFRAFINGNPTIIGSVLERA